MYKLKVIFAKILQTDNKKIYFNFGNLGLYEAKSFFEDDLKFELSNDSIFCIYQFQDYPHINKRKIWNLVIHEYADSSILSFYNNDINFLVLKSVYGSNLTYVFSEKLSKKKFVKIYIDFWSNLDNLSIDDFSCKFSAEKHTVKNLIEKSLSFNNAKI